MSDFSLRSRSRSNEAACPWTRRERSTLVSLSNPIAVQTYLNTLRYHQELTCRSPRQVLADQKANCLEAALLAAAALEYHGSPPILVNLAAVRDDDHVIALYRHKRLLGAVAQGAHPGLGFRSPLFTSLRNLVASYFDHYTNDAGIYTLRRYSLPLVLTPQKFPDWQVRGGDLDDVVVELDGRRHYPIRSPLLFEDGLVYSKDGLGFC